MKKFKKAYCVVSMVFAAVVIALAISACFFSQKVYAAPQSEETQV